MVANSSDVEWALLSCAYDQAIAGGESYCEYLRRVFCETNSGILTGVNRLISSVSSAGHSTSFSDQQPVDQASAIRLLARAMRRCPSCVTHLGEGASPDQIVDCVFASTRPITSFSKSYWSLRYGCCGSGSSTTAPSVPSVPSEAPDAPANLDATDNIVDRVDLSWTASAGATSYEIWRGSSVSTGSMALLAETTAAIFSDTSAVLGTPYFYSLKAKNAAGTSEFALPAEGIRQVSIVSLSLSPSSVTAPPTAISTGTVTLNGVPGSALTVTLSHDAPGGLLTMPSGLQLIAVSSRTFEIVVLASQPSPVVVTVTATYQGVSVTAQLTVSA